MRVCNLRFYFVGFKTYQIITNMYVLNFHWTYQIITNMYVLNFHWTHMLFNSDLNYFPKLNENHFNTFHNLFSTCTTNISIIECRMVV